jgi:hypothetical protein
MVRGSVGFIIEEARPNQFALVPSILKEAIDETSSVISSLSGKRSADFDRTLPSLSPRTVEAIKRMAKTLHDFGADTQIVADTRELSLTLERTSTLYSRLFEVEYLERVDFVDGVLLGVFPERQQYEFKPDGDAPVFYGPVSEGFDSYYLAHPDFARSVLFQPVVGKFTVGTTLRGDAILREEFVLEAVDLLPRRERSGEPN